jgi:hypothetical protein
VFHGLKDNEIARLLVNETQWQPFALFAHPFRCCCRQVFFADQGNTESDLSEQQCSVCLDNLGIVLGLKKVPG